MKFRLRFIFLLAAACVAFPERSPAPVVFQPGRSAHYHPPGEEEVSGNARQLFDIGQAAEKAGNYKRAIKAYSRVVRRYPRDVLAPDAAFLTAQLQEKIGAYARSAEAYRYVVEHFSRSPHFEDAIEAQFRIGELLLNGKKRKILGVPVSSSYGQAVEIFAAIVRTAPYGKYTVRAQFDIGLAREKQGLNEAALAAYQAVVDKFPDNPLAEDAQYQIGYIWYAAARAGVHDPSAITKARTAFSDFLFRYPHSEKAAQAKEDLQRLNQKETTDSLGVAKFYDKRKNYRAAVIYYNEVIREQPGSPESDKAKRRVDELRAKVGDAALQPAIVVNPNARKKPTDVAHGGPSSRGEVPAMRTSPADVAPLPPPDTDVSLPPPASLAPDTTTAPATASPTPEASAPPDTTASPTP